MNRTMVWALVLAVGILAIGKVAFSDIMARTDALFFAEPIPCHVYLKAQRALAGSTLHYNAGSFFQAKVQLLRFEPDIITPQLMKNFIQAQLERHPESAERHAQRQRQFKEFEPDYKALVLLVLETLEGPSPGKEIVLLGFSERTRLMGPIRVMVEKNMERYMLGYVEMGGRIRGVSVDRNDLYERDDWFLTDLKRWVRWFLSECDNV